MALNPATDKQPEPRTPLPPSDLDALIDSSVSSDAPSLPSNEPSIGPLDDAVFGAQEALDELGRFLTDAGGRFAEIDRLFGEATRPFGELSTLLTEARAIAQEASEARQLAGELEQELALRSAELDAVQRSLAQEVKRREQSDAGAAEALETVQRLEAELLQERDRGDELESELEQAEVTIAASVEEANSERKRAEAARLEAEARRLEAEAARLEASAVGNDLAAARMERGPTARERITRRLAADALDESDDADPEGEASALESDEEFAAVEMDEETAFEVDDETAFEGVYQAGLHAEGQAAVEDNHQAVSPSEHEPMVEDDHEAVVPSEQESMVEDNNAVLPAEQEPPAEVDEEGTLEAYDEAGLETEEETELEVEEETASDAGDEHAVSPLVWTHSAKLAMTAALADCEGPRRLLDTAVRVLGSRGGWDVVLAWTFDSESQSWTCGAVWSSTHDETASLQARLGQLRLSLDSPVARAAADGRLSWCGGPNAAAKAGLDVLDSGSVRSIVMLPLVDGAYPIAVMELCSRHEGRPADSLRRALEGIAAEVAGTYVSLEPEQEGPRWNRWLRR